SITKEYLKISVTLDTELKPFADLFAACLAEGKTWANKTNKDAAGEWRDNRKAFRGLQWFYDRDYVLRSVVGRYVSVVRSDDWFDGAPTRTGTPIRFCGTISGESRPIFAGSLPRAPITVR